MAHFKPSKLQQDIFQEFRMTNNNMLIGARAGSGKTRTLLELLKLSRTSDVRFLAFNNSIVKELQNKVSFMFKNKVTTMHSLGFQAIRNQMGKVYLQQNKIKSYCYNNLTAEYPFKERAKAFRDIQDLANIYRLMLCNTPGELRVAAQLTGKDWTEKTINSTCKIMHAFYNSGEYGNNIDFTDMIYLPAIDSSFQLPNPKLTFVDECQDLSACQHRLLDRIVGENRLVAVGDPCQSIYLFAGADTNSFNLFKENRSIKEFPLSITYRCSKAVTLEAQKIYPDIEYADFASEGEVIESQEIHHFLKAEKGDMIICRNTAPLVDIYFPLLASGKKCKILGKDIEAMLINLLKQYEGKTLNGALQLLKAKSDKLILQLENDGIETPLYHPKYTNLAESRSIVKTFSQYYEDVDDLIESLSEIFSSNEEIEKEVIPLCTIHKSKGLEAENVFFVNRHLIPSKYAVNDEQIKQELNLKYVGITRAKNKLIYCTI